MIEIAERIFVAGEYACSQAGSDFSWDGAPREGLKWAVIHACKSPCHQTAVGYKGNLSKSHPNYLVLERDNDLFLNMIDPPAPLFQPPLFTAALQFSDTRWRAGKAVLFHCNQGRSRAPSLALLHLAKARRAIDNSSYAAARREFEGLYEFYAPGNGIERYLTEHWTEFDVCLR